MLVITPSVKNQRFLPAPPQGEPLGTDFHDQSVDWSRNDNVGAEAYFGPRADVGIRPYGII